MAVKNSTYLPPSFQLWCSLARRFFCQVPSPPWEHRCRTSRAGTRRAETKRSPGAGSYPACTPRTWCFEQKSRKTPQWWCGRRALSSRSGTATVRKLCWLLKSSFTVILCLVKNEKSPINWNCATSNLVAKTSSSKLDVLGNVLKKNPKSIVERCWHLIGQKRHRHILSTIYHPKKYWLYPTTQFVHIQSIWFKRNKLW